MATQKQKFQIRAKFDQKTISVYQAYSKTIVLPAVKNQKLVPPFVYDRMTWIKPSFLWMMYRSDWARKPGQDRILEIKIKRDFWESLLTQAILTTPEKHVYSDAKKWRKSLDNSKVRVQWDPERNIKTERLDYKSIQVGICPPLTEDYAKKSILEISEVTSLAHKVQSLVASKNFDKAESLLPKEEEYLVSQKIKDILGMD